jgi:hypothetical protein
MAAGNPSNFNATGFNRSIKRTVELKGGKMRDKVQMATGDLYRESGIYPFITGGGLPTKITNRFPDSPVSESEYSNRAISRADYNDGQYADRADLDRMVVDPRYEKTDILLQKFRRLEDLTIQEAMLGVALGGDAGATNKIFDTNNIINVNLGADSGVTTAGFTYEKLLATIKKFGTNNVDIEQQKPCFTMGWEQWADMMAQDKFINLDYSKAQPIDGGGLMLPDYMGCDFMVTNIVPYMADATTFNIDFDLDVSAAGNWADTDTTDIRAVIASVKDSTLFEVKPDIVTKVSERADKSFRWYTYIEMGLGAVRMEEAKVIAVPSDQSPA